MFSSTTGLPVGIYAVFADDNRIKELRFYNVKKQKDVFSDALFEEIELHLQDLLDECSRLIGAQPDDEKKGVYLERGIYTFLSSRGWDDETFERMQPSYLRGRIKKCQNTMRNCLIPDDHIDPRRSPLFMAKLVLKTMSKRRLV